MKRVKMQECRLRITLSLIIFIFLLTFPPPSYVQANEKETTNSVLLFRQTIQSCPQFPWQ
jgi:hypothetical protein